MSKESKEEKIDVSKIKLSYKDIGGSGKHIFAMLGQEIPCVEFTLKGDKAQPIMTTHREPPEINIGYEMWIQFEPKIWSDMVETVFKEMVELWNEKHGKGIYDG